MNPWCLRRGLAIVCLLPLAADCSSPTGPVESIDESAEALGSCNSSGVQVVDVEGDLRDLWAGREVAATGKEAQPDARVPLDFNVTVDPNLVVGQFIPIVTDGTCGGTISTTKSGMVVAAATWGTVSSNATRPTVPSPYNLFTREAVAGIPSVAGAIAAGGDITLSSFGVNGTAQRTVGLVAGARVVLANGSVFGNVTYGTASTIPQSVSVTGTKTLAPFAGASAFAGLEGLSTLLAEEATTGTVQNTSGTLKFTGTKSGRNIFRVSADAVAQAQTIQITVPASAGAIIDVTGATVVLENKTITLQGVTPATLLWNLAGATSLRIGSIGLQGSVLAPRAPLSMPSGSINGTVVAKSFTSPGSGSLLHTPLNATVLFASTAPSSVELRPAQSLVRGCTYDFLVSRTRVLTTGGGCLGSDLRVRFRVAKTAVSPAGRELVSAIVDPTAQTLRTFEARPGINTLVPDVLKRYQTVIGVLPDELVPTGAARPSSTVPGETFTTYQQFSRGYPVFGYGYLVASANGIFRSANGKTMPNLPAFSTSPITAAQAVQSALTFLQVTTGPWVTDPSRYHPPISTLGLLQKKPDPTANDFRLVWDIRFLGTGIVEPAGITVDAVSNTVVGTDPSLVRIVPLESNAEFQNSLVSNTVTPLYQTGSQMITVGVYKQPSTGQLVRSLALGRLGAPGISQAVYLAPTGAVQWVTDPTPDTPWTTTEATEQAMATAFWGLQRAEAFLPKLGFRPSPTAAPWTKFDGAGAQSIVLSYREAASPTEAATMGYDAGTSDASLGFIRFSNGRPGPSVERDSLPHETGHLLLGNIRRAVGLRPDLDSTGESGALKEALSDLFGLAAIHSELGEIADWHCITEINQCIRSPLDPPSLPDPKAASVPFPHFYKSAQYFTTTATCERPNDFCFVHHNSTVVSYWGFLLALGSKKVGANVCALDIEPVDPNVDAAFKTVLNIAFLAAGTRIGLTPISIPTLVDFRDATIRVAREMALQSQIPTDVPRKVELAWFAVGLGPASLSESTSVLPNDKVFPADEATSVTPWQNFMWPMEFDGNGNAKAWDFQLADGPFATSVKVEKTNYLRGIEINGERRIFLPLALPFDSAKQYFWRARPTGGRDWITGCYPIHSFQGTTQPGTIANIDVLRTLAPDGKVEPSIDNYTVWNPVEGATQYKTYLAIDDPLCTSGSDIKETTRPNDPVTQGNSLVNMDLEPSEHYWLNVQPIGPPDFAGNPSLGACYGTEFETSSLNAPAILAPANGTLLRDDLELALAWTVSTGSETSRLRFYEIDQNGNCETTPVPLPNDEVSSPCNNFTCTAETRTIQFTPPNPTGYCWDVTAIAGNGVESAPSAQGRFRYFHGTLKKLAPGVQEGVFVTLRTPALLPGKESYGKGVTFSWNADPYVAAYAVRLWKYEVNAQVFPPVVVDPPNCGGATTNHSCSKPKNVLLQQTTSGTSITVPESGPGSRGRYCWDVWPLMGDLGNLSAVSPRQPLVSLFPSFCYTSAPAEPKIVVDNPPGTTFSSEEITGHIEFPYVPDYQFEIKGNSDDISFGPGCTVAPDAYLYFDVFDCKVSFTITPQEQQTYKITARTFNSDAPMEPVMDDSTEVHEIVKELKTGNCGAKTEPCCPDETCDAAAFPLACNNDVCVECGNGGEPCCAGNTCPSNKSPGNSANLVCSGGQCKTCGNENTPCCTTGTACKQSNNMCDQGTCKRCGLIGNMCCPVSPGVSGKGCGTDGDCKSGKCAACGDTNQPCCFDGNPMGLCNKHPDTTSCVLGPKTCQACGHKGQPCCSGTISGGLNKCNPGTSCAGDNKCQSCGRPGEPCCLSPQQQCFNSGSVCQSNLVCSGAPPSGSANLSFSVESPLYAPVAQPFPPGIVINVRVCNNGTAAASAFVQADVLAMYDTGLSSYCTLFGVKAFASGWLYGSCNGGPLDATDTLYQPTIQPGSCETFLLETFYGAQGIYDWVFSINGSGTGAIESVYQCINTQPPACVRTL